tara:strand:+ start:1377 stop:2060 length:684 start_codon:yes stop_codon:yes gene_type:complete
MATRKFRRNNKKRTMKGGSSIDNKIENNIKEVSELLKKLVDNFETSMDIIIKNEYHSKNKKPWLEYWNNAINEASNILNIINDIIKTLEDEKKYHIENLANNNNIDYSKYLNKYNNIRQYNTEIELTIKSYRNLKMFISYIFKDLKNHLNDYIQSNKRNELMEEMIDYKKYFPIILKDISDIGNEITYVRIEKMKTARENADIGGKKKTKKTKKRKGKKARKSRGRK